MKKILPQITMDFFDDEEQLAAPARADHGNGSVDRPTVFDTVQQPENETTPTEPANLASTAQPFRQLTIEDHFQEEPPTRGNRLRDPSSEPAVNRLLEPFYQQSPGASEDQEADQEEGPAPEEPRQADQSDQSQDTLPPSFVLPDTREAGVGIRIKSIKRPNDAANTPASESQATQPVQEFPVPQAQDQVPDQASEPVAASAPAQIEVEKARLISAPIRPPAEIYEEPFHAVTLAESIHNQPGTNSLQAANPEDQEAAVPAASSTAAPEINMSGLTPEASGLTETSDLPEAPEQTDISERTESTDQAEIFTGLAESVQELGESTENELTTSDSDILPTPTEPADQGDGQSEGSAPASNTRNDNDNSAKSKRGRKSLREGGAEAGTIEIPADEVLFSKQYYTMGEVAEMFHVNQSLLRFWETEFNILQPKKNKKGDRYFRPIDIKNLHLIYHLLRQRKYTIEGAREFLKQNKKAEDRFEAIRHLQNIRAFLVEWRAQL